MSEGIIKALMHLFAIIANGGDDDEKSYGRQVVTAFLQIQLSQKLVEEYLSVFDSYLFNYQNQKRKREGKSRKANSLSSVKILRICTQINEELQQKEKFIVLIRLIEFIHASKKITSIETEFIDVVAETFHISKEDYNLITDYVNADTKLPVDQNCFLHIYSKSKGLKNTREVIVDNFDGELHFFRIEKENMFFVRYHGNDQMFMNGQPMYPGKILIFPIGAAIRSSKINTIYYSDIVSTFMDAIDNQKLILKAEGVSYKFGNKEIGLRSINIQEKSGKLVGIMGASGSGKSTLLNVLNGNLTPSEGKVTINGIDIHKESNKIEGVIGHVAQDDLLLEELTVYQNLYFNAQLCFAKLSKTELNELVLTTLQSLGLSDSIHLKVGSPLEKTISGGQRKRLNIALELIREPAVLFLDEPTSGLSSRDSENIMDLLKELTLKGKLIFVVIHQPSSDIFKMFDKLFLLDKGGYPIYYGNPVESVSYFKKIVHHANRDDAECGTCGNVNPEQIFNIVESNVVDEFGNTSNQRKITAQEWGEHYQNNIEKNPSPVDEVDEIPTTTFKVPSKLKQWSVFVVRDVLSKASNRQYILINFLEAPLLAFVLSFFLKFFNEETALSGYLFNENENLPQYIFISVIVALFLGLTVSAEEIIRDQKILKREKFLNLSKSSYLFSKIGIMFTISAIQMLTFVITGNTVMEIQGMSTSYWLMLFTTSCFANILGLNISASFNSAKVIYIIIPILIIPQLLFSGVIVKFDKLHPLFSSQSGVPLIGNVMASRWAYEAIAVRQFKENDYETIFYKWDSKKKYANWKKDYWIKNLKNKISYCKEHITDEHTSVFESNIAILHSELSKESAIVPSMENAFLSNLTSENIDLNTLKQVELALKNLNKAYIQSYNNAEKEREKLLQSFVSTKEKQKEFISFKNTYANQSLTDFVTDKNSLNRIIEHKGDLIAKVDPIYMKPYHKSFLNSHFYAPVKKVGSKFVDTYNANLLMLWLMSFGLLLLLMFDGLKKFLELFNKKTYQ